MDKIKRYESLKKKITEAGLILKGTITERRLEREGRAYGPYYQWTFKKAGKTVTVNLTKEQSKRYGEAMENYRRIRRTLKEMEKLSLEILEASTTGVKKRKHKDP